MRVKNFAILLIPILALFACQKDAGGVVSYNIDEAVRRDVEFSSIRYNPLETSDEALVGNIKKVLFRNHLFYIFDDNRDCVLIFWEDGSFKQSIERHGSGPGEFVLAMDMDVDEDGNLYISDVGRQCLIVYSGEDYQDYSEIQVGYPFVEFLVENAHSIYLAGVARNGTIDINLAHLDTRYGKLNVIEETKYENEYSTLRFAPQSLFRTSHGLFYYSHLSHLVLFLKEGSALEHVAFKSDRWPSSEVMESWQGKGTMDILRDRNFIHDLSAYYETDTHILAQLTAIPPLQLLVDKQSEECYILNKVSDPSFPVFPNARACSDKYFITTCIPTAQNIEKILQNASIDDSCRQKLQALNEESNPILIIFSFY